MQPEEQVQKFQADYKGLYEEIGRIIVGNKPIIDGVLTCLFAGGHALLEGVPGLGKTLLIRTLSEVLDLHFTRIQFTPDLMPADIVGTNILAEDDQGRKHFQFQPGPIFTNICLADEINRATPKTQSAMLEAMQEKIVTVGGQTRQLPKPFFVMATQNPLEMEGTYPLPEAQLDRFFFKIMLEYPTRNDLNEVLRRTTRGEFPTAKKVMDGAKILEYQMLARNVVVAPHVLDYATRLILGTHPEGEYAAPMINRYVRYGSSPRGAQAIILGAKIQAMLDGRYNVAFVDIETVAKAALRHRMIMNFEGQAEGINPDTIVTDLLAHVPREAPVPV